MSADPSKVLSYLVVPACFLTLLLVDMAALYREKSENLNRDLVGNLASLLIGAAVYAALSIPFTYSYKALYHYAPIHLGMGITGIFAAYLIFELKHYIEHRIGHRVGLFWAFHSVHHSSKAMNVAVSSRMFWGNIIVQPLTLTLPLFGLSIEQFAIVNALTGIVGIISHTTWIPQIRILDLFVMTPSNHRVHHGCNARYLDTNYGQSTCLYDRLFGTYEAEREKPIYGLIDGYDQQNPFKFQLAGIAALASKVARAPSLKSSLLYLVMPPGWSATGEHTTTAALRGAAKPISTD